MGYVEELPSGRYRGVPWNAKAKKRGKSESFDSWAEADAYWRRVEAELDGTYAAAGLTVDRQRRGVPSWAEHVVDWARKDPPDSEKGTLRSYRTQARKLAERWPTQRVDEITDEQITDYLAELRDAGIPGVAFVARGWGA